MRGGMLANAMNGTSPRHTCRLRSGTNVEIRPDGALLRHAWGAFHVGVLPEVGAALAALSVQDLDADAVADVLAVGAPLDDHRVAAALAQLDSVLRRLPLLVTRSVFHGKDALVMVEPISDRAPALERKPFAVGTAFSLDRFAYLRRRPEASGLFLESPLALHRARIGAPLLALIARAADGPLAVEQVVDPAELAAAQLLVAAGLLRGRSPDQDDDVRLGTWSFHDLVFHGRSRPGRSDELFGAHFIHRDRMEALPAVPPARTGPAVDLPSPNFGAVVASERSLTEVMESRTSVRDYGADPLTVEQLGELLYRSARTRRIVPVHSLGSYDGADHPYPTGGLAGDLELYLSVARCSGLPPGIYHYESAAHRLRWVNEVEDAAPLLDGARVATGGAVTPQALLTVTSRFARTAWKYETIAYALTLKHVGALLQTIYLVATSMGLAPCALGSGDADQSARAFGLDWLVESSVGELVLGSRPEPMRWADRFANIVDRSRRDAGTSQRHST